MKRERRGERKVRVRERERERERDIHAPQKELWKREGRGGSREGAHGHISVGRQEGVNEIRRMPQRGFRYPDCYRKFSPCENLAHLTLSYHIGPGAYSISSGSGDFICVSDGS